MIKGYDITPSHYANDPTLHSPMQLPIVLTFTPEEHKVLQPKPSDMVKIIVKEDSQETKYRKQAEKRDKKSKHLPIDVIRFFQGNPLASEWEVRVFFNVSSSTASWYVSEYRKMRLKALSVEAVKGEG